MQVSNAADASLHTGDFTCNEGMKTVDSVLHGEPSPLYLAIYLYDLNCSPSSQT